MLLSEIEFSRSVGKQIFRCFDSLNRHVADNFADWLS